MAAADVMATAAVRVAHLGVLLRAARAATLLAAATRAAVARVVTVARSSRVAASNTRYCCRRSCSQLMIDLSARRHMADGVWGCE